MNLRELQEVLETADDVYADHIEGNLHDMTKLDKDQLIDLVKFAINWSWLRDTDEMDDAPMQTIDEALGHDPSDRGPVDLDEVDRAAKVDEQNIL